MQDLIINENSIKDKIYTIRNMQVMLDRDLAELYVTLVPALFYLMGLKSHFQNT